ncbi:hypothetical protein PISMIDRAFT_677279 [Pisolithus microcarpus 441]|uniref:Uncharacterized protein n=1 Tax=Pisolithus microcarpus 441 TaxID=765257 RepID=A0A0C9ZH01_9AGAM|nr:hypothetical protein PISMIDRAFT_677279 [Pisolithus microcarpus 441]
METNIRTATLHSRSLYFTPPLRNMFLNDEGMWPPANLTRVGTREEYIKVSRRARTSSGDEEGTGGDTNCDLRPLRNGNRNHPVGEGKYSRKRS